MFRNRRVLFMPYSRSRRGRPALVEEKSSSAKSGEGRELETKPTLMNLRTDLLKPVQELVPAHSARQRASIRPMRAVVCGVRLHASHRRPSTVHQETTPHITVSFQSPCKAKNVRAEQRVGRNPVRQKSRICKTKASSRKETCL